MSYLPPTRVLRERRESARALTALFYREQAVILACGRFIVRTPLLDAKAALGWVAWESALAADALRERVFELRYPTRFLDEQAEEFHVATAGDLLELVHRVQGDYLEYGEEADPLADGPSQRIVEAAARGKGRHLGALDAFELTDEDPARDPAYFRSPVYWPDVLDPEYPYGEGVALQIRSAVSHLNEVWAVETAGRILAELSAELGWEFTLDASRWLYDETRHMLMGKERLARWGLQPGQIPLGGYIYEAWQHEDPLYGLGMLGYFETKNIGRKRERAAAFRDMGDATSETDMEFDWADETLHAEYGRRWLRRLLEVRGEDPESWPVMLERCEELVEARIARATPDDLDRIRTCADALVAAAEARAS